MSLIIDNKYIEEPIINIVRKLRSELNNGKLKDIIDKGDNVMVSCPAHKNGHENHASCQIYANIAGDLAYGTAHCFTCGYVDSLVGFINKCFDSIDNNKGKQWLLDNFGNVFVKRSLNLDPISLNVSSKRYLDEKILDKFKYRNDYLIRRGISNDILEKFKVGYDPEFNCVVFPVWDEHNNLVMLTKRSVTGKRFFIDKDISKPVYLLNYIIFNNISTVYVCESQINALTLWTWGYPAVALIGTGSKEQYAILNKSGINNFILCLDGDEAGHKGIERFKQNISNDKLISIKKIPDGKDVNDLTKDEFLNLDTVY